MSITWIPIDQCPEEWKDGRKVLITSSDNPLPIIGHWHKGFFVRSIDGCVFATHVAAIPPELRIENIGLGKRVSVKMMGNSRWVLDSNDHTATIIKMERDYHVSQYVGAHPFSNEILWKELGTYPTLQAAIDAFEETLP